MYAVITLIITIFILHLCAESLKNSVLISSKDLSSQISIVNPRPYWKRWREVDKKEIIMHCNNVTFLLNCCTVSYFRLPMSFSLLLLVLN